MKIPRQLLIILLACAFAWLQFRAPPDEQVEANRIEAAAPVSASASSAPPSSQKGRSAGLRQTGPFTVAGVRITDIRDGEILPITSVDLKPTLDRIARGEKFPHANDGSVFRNRERSLPSRQRGYYREYVVPTPGISGPGPQRLIVGEGGEIYYTPDHYATFIRIEKHE